MKILLTEQTLQEFFNRTVETMSLFRNLNTFKQDQVLSVQNAKPGIAHKLMLP